MTNTRLTIRFDAETEEKIAAAAERHSVPKAEWVRGAALAALTMEASGFEQATSLVDLTQKVHHVEQTLDRVQTSNGDVKRTIDDLLRTIAIERAADRFMMEQVLRSAVRAAYVALQIAVEGRIREGEGCITQLCKEADDAFKEGLAFVEEGMDRARGDMAQTLRRGLQT